jgi:hypothetical protein
LILKLADQASQTDGTALLWYVILLRPNGAPATTAAEASAVLATTDPGHGKVEPEDPAAGAWLVELSTVTAAHLCEDRYLDIQSAGWRLIAEMP